MFYINAFDALTDKRLRAENQDRCGRIDFMNLPTPGAESNCSVLYVLDGVSHGNGGEASSTAEEALRRPLCELCSMGKRLLDMSEQDRKNTIFRKLKAAIRQSDWAVRETLPPGSASTVSIACVFGDKVYTCNVGDSGIYLLRLAHGMDQELVQLHECHNRAGEKQRMGLISKEEMLTDKDSNRLLKMVGGSGMALSDEDIYAQCETMAPGLNVIMLGSDGALSVLPENRMRDIFVKCRVNGHLDTCTQTLFDEVEKVPEATDNFTLIAELIELV